jgi:hypothetical protein
VPWSCGQAAPLELVQAAFEVGVDVFAGGGPLEQHRQVVGAPLQRLEERQILLGPPPPLHEFLRFGLVAPEAGRGRLLFYLRELLVEASPLKDTSVVPQPGG